jgi:phenylacetate-CoA ligase
VARDNAHDFVSALNRYRPAVLTGYGSAFLLLARFMLELDLRLDYLPKAVIPTSDALTEEGREVMEKAYGAPVFEEYGSVENTALATQCECGSLHVSPDFGILEILDSTGKPCAPGREGRVVATGLLNDAHYLFRYEIGDLGSWSASPCRCGRDAFPVLEGVFGRSDDYLETPSGPRKFSLAGLFVHVPGLVGGQVVQERPDLLRVRLLVTPAFTPNSEKMVESRIQERRLDMNIVFEKVDELERNERGKIRAVIRQI